MLGLKRFFSLVSVFTLTLILGSSSKSQNGPGEQKPLSINETSTSKSNFVDGNDGNKNSSDILRKNAETQSPRPLSEIGHANNKTTENNPKTKPPFRNRNGNIQSQESEQELSSPTAQFTSAELFESTSSNYDKETTSESPEADEIDSTTHAIEQSYTTATKTRILKETSTVSSATSATSQHVSLVTTSDQLNVITIQSKSPSRTQTSVVKVLNPATKLSSPRKSIETTERTTTWDTIKTSSVRHQTRSSELSFKQNGGEVETSVTDNQDLNKTPEHVTTPCEFNRHGDFYDSSSLIAAAIGGAFVGGALVLAAFYCKKRFHRYLRGDYRRVPMEYDFELNPRLKFP